MSETINFGRKKAITDLDIEVYEGRVVGVWFGNQPLPFKQWEATLTHATEMDAAYADEDGVGEELAIKEIVMH